MRETIEDSIVLLFLMATVAAGTVAVFSGHSWGAAIAGCCLAADLGRRALAIRAHGFEQRLGVLEGRLEEYERQQANMHSAEKMMCLDLKNGLSRVEERLGTLESDKAATAVHPTFPVFR